MRSTSADVFFAFAMNLCFLSSLVLGRLSGSLLRQSATKSLKPLVKSPSSVGGGFFGIRKSTRIGWRSELGGSPLASSIAVIPSDQISALTSYLSKETINTMRKIRNEWVSPRSWDALTLNHMITQTGTRPQDSWDSDSRRLLDHLWRHPERGSHKRRSLCHSFSQLPRNTKVGQFDITRL